MFSVCTFTLRLQFGKPMKLTGICISAAMLLCAPCVGQDRGKLAYTDEELLVLCERTAKQSSKRSIRSSGYKVYPRPSLYSPPMIASYMSAVYEVILEGEFLELPTRTGLDPESLNPRNEIVGFRVAEVYKGQVPESIDVEVASDLLAFPENGISRYWKRQQAIKLANSRPPHPDDEGLRDSNNLSTEHGYDTSLPSDAEQSFHQAGYAIKERERYLIGAKAVPGRANLYRMMGERLNPILFWGEMKEDVITAIQSPQAFDKPTPFGNYDPNNDEHCDILRDLIGTLPESTPRLAAEHLLDTYQLVAQVELHEVPEFTPEMLHWLYSEEVRVRFRILERFKGDAIDFVEIALNSDMLSDDGEAESRYVKRRGILKDYKASVVSNYYRMRELDEALGAGTLDPQTLEDKGIAMWDRQVEYDGKYTEPYMMSDREVSSWLGDTFYERGGIIQPFSNYVIGVNNAPDGEDVYVLGELPESPSRIYWGAEGEQIVRQLDELTR